MTDLKPMNKPEQAGTSATEDLHCQAMNLVEDLVIWLETNPEIERTEHQGDAFLTGMAARARGLLAQRAVLAGRGDEQEHAPKAASDPEHCIYGIFRR